MRNENWHTIPWKSFYEKIAKLQQELVMAYKVNDSKRVYRLQREIVSSMAARSIAVRRVATNTGGKTPGVDGVVWGTPTERYSAIAEVRETINSPKRYKASPVKRIYIPKGKGNELRPLGIPTMIDRAVQAIYHLALDPIVEQQSDPSSYGFRRYRSTHDAITRLRSLLDKTVSPHWVLDADVAKCFDTISHDFLLRNTLLCDRSVLEQWLISGVMEGREVSKTDVGTPQGGIISPLLCNITLNGMETAVKQPTSKEGRPKVHLTRYADDFVVTGKTETILTQQVKPAIAEFLDARGLKFKVSKTQTINIAEGFDFLGFNLQRKPWSYKLNQSSNQESVLIIKPKRENIQKVRDRILQVITPKRPLGSIIHELNPVLRGWAEYYRISYHSLHTFGQIGHYVWQRMWKWGRRRHPTRSAQWIYSKYIVPGGQRKWIFGKSLKESLFDISTVTHIKVFPLKGNVNPYILDNSKYYQERAQERVAAKFRAAVYHAHSHMCPHCGEFLHNGEPIELHHIVPVGNGGKYTLSNIQPLHRTCHQSVTYVNQSKIIG